MPEPRLKEIFDELWELHCKKDADYSGEVPFQNFRSSEQFGVPAWKGAAIRMGDKWSRVVNLLGGSGAQVVSESIFDTLKDLAVYAIIVHILLEQDEHIGRPARQNKQTGGIS